jgi:hypothetical protein
MAGEPSADAFGRKAGGTPLMLLPELDDESPPIEDHLPGRYRACDARLALAHVHRHILDCRILTSVFRRSFCFGGHAAIREGEGEMTANALS